MHDELLSALNELGPLDKVEQTRMPTSPLNISDKERESAHYVRYQRMMEAQEEEQKRLEERRGGKAAARRKRALPADRSAVREEATVEVWKVATAPVGSGLLSERQAENLFSEWRTKHNGMRSPVTHEEDVAKFSKSFGLDEATFATLVKHFASPHLAMDKRTDMILGTWEPRPPSGPDS